MTTLLNPTNETIINHQAAPEGRFFNAAEAPKNSYTCSLIGQLAVFESEAEVAQLELAAMQKGDWENYQKASYKIVHGNKEPEQVATFGRIQTLLEHKGRYADTIRSIELCGKGLVGYLCDLRKPQVLNLGQDRYWTAYDNGMFRLREYDAQNDDIILFNGEPSPGDKMVREPVMDDYARLLLNVEQARVTALSPEPQP